MESSRRQLRQISRGGHSLPRGPRHLLARAPRPVPKKLVATPARDVPPLPLLRDGSAREYAPKDAGPISEPPRWRFTKGEPPDIEYDHRKLHVRITAGGTVKRSGTLTFADLEPLPRHSQMVLLQCGAPNPRGIAKWTQNSSAWRVLQKKKRSTSIRSKVSLGRALR